jgi:hypothetical protein
MIVCRKPCTVYDVDVIGMAVLVVLSLAACFCVVIPAGKNGDEYRVLSTEVSSTRNAIAQANGRLRQVNAEISLLEKAVSERTRAAAKPGELTPFLHQVVSLAEACDLEVAQVLPEPVRRSGGCLVGEARFSGRGNVVDFLRLLDQLGQKTPTFALKAFSIKGAGKPDDSRCILSWTMRLYMLDDASTDDLGEPS